MLNDMIASFVASNQIGEEMKKTNAAKGLGKKNKTSKKLPPQNPAMDNDGVVF
jgi:hypothetical protein